MRNSAIPSLLPVYKRVDITFDRGEGSWLFDRRGRKYLDFGCGIAVTGLGHAHPHLLKVLNEQAAKLWHVSNLYKIDQLETLADRLVANSFAETVFVCNSGAEAIEACVKMVRRYWFAKGNPKRNRIITFEGAFHGRTITAISAVNSPKLTEGFEPLLDGFDQVPLGDLDALRAAITDETAGILIEPIQGEGGIRPVPVEQLQAMRQICDETGILLVFDEIQTGMGRTGQLFAHQALGVTPDIMALAKGLGGGFPIGACVATAEAASGMVAGTHGSTFGGNPLACAVANGVLDVMLADGFLAEVARKGELLHRRLLEVAARHPDDIVEVRGMGLIHGIRTGATNTDVCTALREAGLIVIPAADNVLRLLPPLTISEAEIEQAVQILSDAFRAKAA